MYAYTHVQTFAPIMSGQVLCVLSIVQMCKLYVYMHVTIHMCNISVTGNLYVSIYTFHNSSVANIKLYICIIYKYNITHLTNNNGVNYPLCSCKRLIAL